MEVCCAQNPWTPELAVSIIDFITMSLEPSLPFSTTILKSHMAAVAVHCSDVPS